MSQREVIENVGSVRAFSTPSHSGRRFYIGKSTKTMRIPTDGQSLVPWTFHGFPHKLGFCGGCTWQYREHPIHIPKLSICQECVHWDERHWSWPYPSSTIGHLSALVRARAVLLLGYMVVLCIWVTEQDKWRNIIRGFCVLMRCYRLFSLNWE